MLISYNCFVSFICQCQYRVSVLKLKQTLSPVSVYSCTVRTSKAKTAPCCFFVIRVQFSVSIFVFFFFYYYILYCVSLACIPVRNVSQVWTVFLKAFKFYRCTNSTIISVFKSSYTLYMSSVWNDYIENYLSAKNIR